MKEFAAVLAEKIKTRPGIFGVQDGLRRGILRHLHEIVLPFSSMLLSKSERISRMNSGVGSPLGSDHQCARRNGFGTRAVPALVSSITTGKMKRISSCI